MVSAGNPELVDQSRFIGKRKPTIGAIELDEVALKLANKNIAH
jgi:hypothetical protein